MTGIPGDHTPESGDAGGQQQAQQPVLGELKSSLEWLEHAALAGGDLIRLAGLELRLAAGDSGRLLALGLAMIRWRCWRGSAFPCCWPGWYSPGWGQALAIVTFIVVQVITIGIMLVTAKNLPGACLFPQPLATGKH